MEIIDRWAKLINSFDAGQSLQIAAYTRTRGMDEIPRDVTMPDHGDGLDAFRRDYNSLVAGKLESASRNTSTVKTLTVTIREPDRETAVSTLNALCTSLTAQMRAIDECHATRLDRAQRLRLMAEILRPGEPFEFDERAFESMPGRPDTKDLVCPWSIDARDPARLDVESESSRFHHRTLWISGLPPELSDQLINDLTSIRAHVNVSIHLAPLRPGREHDDRAPQERRDQDAGHGDQAQEPQAGPRPGRPARRPRRPAGPARRTVRRTEQDEPEARQRHDRDRRLGRVARTARPRVQDRQGQGQRPVLQGRKPQVHAIGGIGRRTAARQQPAAHDARPDHEQRGDPHPVHDAGGVRAARPVLREQRQERQPDRGRPARAHELERVHPRHLRRRQELHLQTGDRRPVPQPRRRDHHRPGTRIPAPRPGVRRADRADQRGQHEPHQPARRRPGGDRRRRPGQGEDQQRGQHDRQPRRRQRGTGPDGEEPRGPVRAATVRPVPRTGRRPRGPAHTRRPARHAGGHRRDRRARARRRARLVHVGQPERLQRADQRGPRQPVHRVRRERPDGRAAHVRHDGRDRPGVEPRDPQPRPRPANLAVDRRIPPVLRQPILGRPVQGHLQTLPQIRARRHGRHPEHRGAAAGRRCQAHAVQLGLPDAAEPEQQRRRRAVLTAEALRGAAPVLHRRAARPGAHEDRTRTCRSTGESRPEARCTGSTPPPSRNSKGDPHWPPPPPPRPSSCPPRPPGPPTPAREPRGASRRA